MAVSASRSLPSRPSLEQLRKQAKDLVDAWRAGDVLARERVRAHKPQAREPLLADAQFVLAREYGFDSWPKLAHYVELRDAPAGLSARPPFVRIDWNTNTLEPRQALTDDDWKRVVAVIDDYGITGVNANGRMTDAGLAMLSRVPGLTRLHLGGTRYVSDDGVRQLASMPQLEELDLSDHPGGTVTDRGLEALRALPNLRVFSMCWQRGISDAGVANLASCERLERVDLLGSPTGDGAIKALRGKSGLRQFKTGRFVTDTGLAMLDDLPVFKTWLGGETRYDLMSFGDTHPNFLMLDGPFTDRGFARLAALEGIFGVGLFWHVSNLTSDAFRVLPALPNLGALGIDGHFCDDTAMEHFAAVPQLRMLMAQGGVATDDGFGALSRSKTIEYIWGRACPNLGTPGFAALAEMPALKGLAVSCKRVDDAGLASLPRFPSLTWLLPMDVTDNGFRHVGQCMRLEKLTCMYCRDTGDVATEHIAGLPNLKEYYAGQTRISDRSLEILGSMPSLEVVELSGCAGITNAGLPHLAKLPALRKVSVDATAHVTREGIAVFPPRVHVDFWS